MSDPKWTVESAKAYARSFGYEVSFFKDAVAARHRATFTCPRGHTYETIWGAFAGSMQQRCKACRHDDMKTPRSEIEALLAKKGATLAAGEFKTSKVPVICKNGHSLFVRLTCIKAESFVCSECVKMELLSRAQGILPLSVVSVSEFDGLTKSILQITCEHGHSYSMLSGLLLNNKSSCPICYRGRQLSFKEKSVIPIPEKWDASSLGSYLKAHGYSLLSDFEGSQKLVTVRCPNDHEYQVKPHVFARGARCKECLRAAMTLRPEHLKTELDRIGYTIDFIQYENQDSTVDITCPEGHKYKGSYNRLVHQGKRCPQCKVDKDRRVRESLFDRAKERIRLSMPGHELLTINSTRDKHGHLQLRLRCPIGHEYNTTYSCLGRNAGCSICTGNQRIPFMSAYLRVKYEAEGYELLDAVWPSVTIRCNKGHEYTTHWDAFSGGHRCPRCVSSKPEEELSKFLTESGVNHIRHDRTVLSGYELDILVPERKAAIEFCGLWWHSVLPAGYHQFKAVECQKAGIGLLTIFEDEWEADKAAVLNRVALFSGLLKERGGIAEIRRTKDLVEVLQDGNVTLVATILGDLCRPKLVLHEHPGPGLRCLADAGYKIVMDAACDFSFGLLGEGQLGAPRKYQHPLLRKWKREMFDCGEIVYCNRSGSLVASQAIEKLKRFSSRSEAPIDAYSISVEKYSQEIRDFIELNEWMGTVGNIPRWCFVARLNGVLAAAILVNNSQSGFSKLPYSIQCDIQRGASAPFAHRHISSRLIGFAVRWLTKNAGLRVFYGYADPLAGEIGTIYQACNFHYLGRKFGVTKLFKHEHFNHGVPFSSQLLNRTSTFLRWCKEEGVTTDKSWFGKSGRKSNKQVPPDVMESFRSWQSAIKAESVEIKKEKKGKYALITGKLPERRSIANILFKKYPPEQYPKR